MRAIASLAGAALGFRGVSLGEVTPQVVENALRQDGGLVVRGVPGLAAANDEAMAALQVCGRLGTEGFFTMPLPDGSHRHTLAAVNGGAVVAEEVASRCPWLERQLAGVRGIVEQMGERVVGAMNSSYSELGPARRAGDFATLVSQGSSMEHFHLYNSSGATGSAIPAHTDSGAFLVLTRATGAPGGMRVLRGDGEHRVELDADEVLLMAGTAMRDILSADVVAPPHYVTLEDVPAGQFRGWYGRMYLLPDDSTNERGQTAKELFMAPLNKPLPWMVQLAEACDTEMAVCWMQDAVCVEKCPDGELQQCLHPDLTKSDCAPDSMDDQCAWRCPKAEPGPSPEPVTTGGFCNTQVSVDMYMKGFTTTAEKDRACIILFFHSWTLDTPWKFAAGCIGVALMGFLTQALIVARSRVQAKGASKFVDSLMFGGNVALGWAIMLVAMTFSVELFLCATAGLMIGHFCLADLGKGTGNKILGTPCCNAVNGGTGERVKTELSSSVSGQPLLFGESRTVTLRIVGMTCDACANTVTGALTAIRGVARADVSFSLKQASVIFQDPATLQQLMDAVGDVGFEASPR